jgi:hypothetical protein
MVERDPLHSRGWVLQESCLSPRTVYLASPQLHWGCRELSASETWPDGIPESLEKFSASPTRYSDLLQLKRLVDQHATGDQILKTWARLVEKYTWFELTYESDRLIAFSAIAKQFATMTNDEYLAGMWKGDLISRLDWTVRWRRSREPISSQYTAPSWSWASIGSAILYYDGHG